MLAWGLECLQWKTESLQVSVQYARSHTTYPLLCCLPYQKATTDYSHTPIITINISILTAPTPMVFFHVVPLLYEMWHSIAYLFHLYHISLLFLLSCSQCLFSLSKEPYLCQERNQQLHVSFSKRCLIPSGGRGRG